ncbi:hypothetical protein GWO43_09450 [candidate division KSB1 bacterium]|nr:hypothetical protein [candidate division KSB1 bacterium]NIT71107.1 hypothetical protein [candidate division KSB1 bacterium]NIX70787.1 hypothetical protein [candidate division KSB1 bacterium]
MKQSLLAIFVAISVLMAASSAHTQYFKFDTADNEQEIKQEVDAILKFFGSVVGGGLFHTADMHSVAGIDVGLRGVVANVPEEFKELPVFAQEDFLGLAFLHGSIGLPANFELMGRFFYFPLGAGADSDITPPRSDSRGGVTLIGGGIKYGLLQLPALPKVMVLGAYHAVFVPDEFDFGTVSTASLKAVASYSIPILTLYVGGGVDFTTLKLNDEFLDGERFDENETQATIGVKANILPLVHVNGSYNFSEFDSFDLGIGISFR